MQIRLYFQQTTCSKPLLWSWRGDFDCRGIRLLPSSSVSSLTSSAARSLSPWPFPASFYWRGKMAFPGTERLRDRKAGQKGGAKGHFPGQNGKGTERRDRRAGTERLESRKRGQTNEFEVIAIHNRASEIYKMENTFFNFKNLRTSFLF